MKNRSKRALVVNTCGAIGYMTCLLLWGWTGIVYVPMALSNERIEQLLLSPPSEEAPPPVPTADISPLAVFVALVVTAIIILLTVFVLFRAPVTIAKTGKTVTSKVADSALPLVTRGRSLPSTKKKRLTAQLVKVSKLLLVLLPVVISFVGVFFEPPLPFEIVIFASSFLALMALVWFSAQYIAAYLLKVDAKQLL